MDDITDFYAWTRQQAEALRRRASNEVDWANVAEEIDALGRSFEDQIESRLEILLHHLLKWKYQPEMRCGSWRASIHEQRRRIARVIAKNPSLRSYPGEYLADAFAEAKPRMLLETGLEQIPDTTCPWTIEQVLDDDFLP